MSIEGFIQSSNPFPLIPFLLRDAMRKRGLCYRPVSVCPFVRPSVRHVRVLYPDSSRYRQTRPASTISLITLVQFGLN